MHEPYKVNIEGKEISLYPNPTSGEGKGKCGVNAFRNAAGISVASKKLYQDITDVLENPDHDKHAICVEYIGRDIAHLLIPSEENNVTLSKKNLENLKKLAKEVEDDDDIFDHSASEKLKKACERKETCLDYMHTDIAKNNWVSIGVILAWAAIYNKNIRIWQKPRAISDEDTLTEMKKHENNEDSDEYLNILFINANHFEFLTTSKPSIKLTSRDDKKKVSPGFFKASKEETKDFVENLRTVFKEDDDYKLTINKKTGKTIIEKDDKKCEVFMEKSDDKKDVLTTVMVEGTSEAELDWLIECTKKLMDEAGKNTLSVEHPDPEIKKWLVQKCKDQKWEVIDKLDSSKAIHP